MKILIHSNAPTARTGYGVQCALLAERLKADGYEVAVSCTFGQQSTVGEWRGIRLYPAGYESQGNDVIHNHALHWFDGDLLGGWVIVLTDVWTMRSPVLADMNVIAWAPVDHFPVPPEVLGFFDRTDAVPVAMSHYGNELFRAAGLDSTLIPLSIDTTAYRPTDTVTIVGRQVTPREMLGVPEDAFLVGMTAMNKDPFDRKGFNEAFRAFGLFLESHPDAVLYVHSDPGGMGMGLNLRELATHASIPEQSIRFSDPYALKVGGFTAEMMAGMYSAFDVLLAPSRGEGFCVPLVEAQACGTPVIASDFSAQTELTVAGWKVGGDPLWDQSQRASYVKAHISEVVQALEDAHDLLHSDDAPRVRDLAVSFAAGFDADVVYAKHWRPFLASLEAEPLELDRTPMGDGRDEVAVIVPAMRRPNNVAPLVESLGDTANVYFVCDPDDTAEISAVEAAGAKLIISDRGHSFAQKANCAFEQTTEPWVFLCGDDVRFSPDWLAAPRKLSDRFDVIGTNDAEDGGGNASVQAGLHADHMLVRRAYVDRYGASLDGPGSLCHEGYNHFFVDIELVRLARARGVFAPCLASVVEHLHPGLGKGQPDLIYQSVDSPESLADRATWAGREPLVEMQRRGRGKR